MCIQHIICICFWMCDIYARMFQYGYMYVYIYIYIFMCRIGTQRGLEMTHLCMKPQTPTNKCLVLVVKMTFITHCCLWIDVCFMDMRVSKCICVTLSCYQEMSRWISRDLWWKMASVPHHSWLQREPRRKLSRWEFQDPKMGWYVRSSHQMFGHRNCGDSP